MKNEDRAAFATGRRVAGITGFAGLIVWLGVTGTGCFIENLSGQGGTGGGLPGTGGAGGTGLPAGKGVGMACASPVECRPPLGCDAASSTCQPTQMAVPGASCVISRDCLPSLYCTPLGRCDARTGMGAAGASCTSEADCAAGLSCVLGGLSGTCAMAGNADVGAACTTTADCLGGLLCAQGRCNSPLAIPPWQGATCNSAEESVPKVLFRIPRMADPPSDDYFQLPFPSDARLVGGKLSMKNFPKPGVRLLPFDPIDRYTRAIEADTTGFALNSRVFFRFSRLLGDNLNKENIVTVWNIDKDSPGYNSRLGHEWQYSPARRNYICDRWMVLRPGSGRLEPGTTYAVVIRSTASNGLRLLDSVGQQFVRDADFDAMMSPTMPADPELVPAWNAHKPLRDWVADPMSGQVAGDILAAAVFTTQKVEDPIAALRAATAALPAAQLAVSGVVKCGEPGVVSPCDDGKSGAEKERGCLPAPANAAYDEYQGRFQMPVWQQGTRPYEAPENGGGIQFDAMGAPMQNATTPTEPVCFSLTVPKGTAPAAGWPVVVYGHGTTGSYVSGVRIGWAQDLATGAAAGGANVPMAMFSYDGALHGTRTGMSRLGVEELVFNLFNPVSARDTALQGAADLFAVARVVAAYDQMGVKLDPAKVLLYGHSQGANAAAIAGGYEPTYKAVVLSGSGGLLARSLTSKTKPINIAGALPFIIGDPVDAQNPLAHPLIAVLQTYFERSDPINFVRRIATAPRMGASPKNFLHVFGTMDTYSPDPTQRELAIAASLPVVGTVLDSYGLPMLASPASANLTVGTDRYTAGQIQYAPAGYDGHFVSSMDAGARAALVRALGSTVRDGVMTIAR